MDVKADEPTSQVYSFKSADPRSALQVLRVLAPTARAAVDQISRTLVVTGSPDDHEKVKAMVEQMEQEAAGENARSVVAYSLEATGAANAFRILRTIVPTATLGVGADPSALIAWARPEDHAIIKEAVDRLETLASADLLVVSPGVPVEGPVFDAVRQRGVEIIGELELAWRWVRGRVIAITGTKGKSTTTTLVGRMLAAAGHRACRRQHRGAAQRERGDLDAGDDPCGRGQQLPARDDQCLPAVDRRVAEPVG